jgi:hypothetical protein
MDTNWTVAEKPELNINDVNSNTRVRLARTSPQIVAQKSAWVQGGRWWWHCVWAGGSAPTQHRSVLSLAGTFVDRVVVVDGRTNSAKQDATYSCT